MSAAPMIKVINAGFFTTIQDLGRPGLAHIGVAAAGALDQPNLRLANRLVGNNEAAAALEMTLTGGQFLFTADTQVALTGAPMSAAIDGDWMPHGQTLSVKAGQRMALGTSSQGLRTYLAVAGGIDTPRVLSSRSTDSVSAIGPSLVANGDRLPLGKPGAPVCRYLKTTTAIDFCQPIRFLRGPHPQYFSERSWQMLTSQPWRVAANSNRAGLRLEGARIARVSAELASEGMVNGAIQVPANGQPIVLLGDHGTSGGYPVMAVVTEADIARLAQARPGHWLQFSEVTMAAALKLRRKQQKIMQQQVLEADEKMLDYRRLLQFASGSKSLDEITLTSGNGWIYLKK